MVLSSAAHTNHETPLLDAQEETAAEAGPFIKRTGTVWTAVAHIITGVIGSGVLSLSWSVAQLGWIAGPFAVVIFAFVTLFATFLLSDCYRTPDPEHGPGRNRSYLEAVALSLGTKSTWTCNLCLHVGLYGMAIAYTVTSGISMRAIQKSNCYHKEGPEAACDYSYNYYMLLFGAVQLILSQSPDFHNIQSLSIIASAMSFAYSFIGFALSLAKVIGNGYVKGSIGGVSTSSSIEKMWLVAQAIGDIAFAYPYSLILIEIQDTLKAPPPANQTMKKASTISTAVTTIFYLFCGGFGYAAFGDDTPGNLLTGFGFYKPYWISDLANACIVIHLAGAYQVFSQPMFAHFEKWLCEKFPNNEFINNEFFLKLPLLPAFRWNPLRLCFRTAYVVSATAIAMIFPYFNQVIGVIGGVIFWPLTIHFPVEMYLKQMNLEAWTRKWVMLRVFNYVCFVVSMFGLVGSIQGLINAKLS